MITVIDYADPPNSLSGALVVAHTFDGGSEYGRGEANSAGQVTLSLPDDEHVYFTVPRAEPGTTPEPGTNPNNPDDDEQNPVKALGILSVGFALCADTQCENPDTLYDGYTVTWTVNPQQTAATGYLDAHRCWQLRTGECSRSTSQ